jgi:hypothetical protein
MVESPFLGQIRADAHEETTRNGHVVDSVNPRAGSRIGQRATEAAFAFCFAIATT